MKTVEQVSEGTLGLGELSIKHVRHDTTRQES